MNFRVSTRINQGVEQTFAIATDLERLPEWEGSFEEVRAETPGPLQVGTRYWCRRTLPSRTESSMTVRELDPNRYLLVEGEWVGFLKPVFDIEVEGNEGGARLTLVARSQLRGVMRVLDPVLGLYGRHASAKYLAALKRLIEAS